MELQAGSLYEVNKQLSAQERVMGAATRKKVQEDLRLWFRDGIETYAMLLCHDRRDYTLFRVVQSPAEAAAALFECLDNRGEVISIEKIPEDSAWEIWLRITDETIAEDFTVDTNTEDYCYYLFCYDPAIIEV